jgi:phosphoribosylanthranilate isomerase
MSSRAEPLWIKICGIRDVETAVRVAELGADAIGINFCDGSPRHVANADTAAAIVKSLPTGVAAVGVFVNQSADQIREICAATGMTTVQLHGDEPDSLIDELPDLQVIRAIRIGEDVAAQTTTLLAGYAKLIRPPSAWLVDARVPGVYGGTGQTVDWGQLAPEHRQGWPRLILAGGLTPDNVAEAVAIVRPDGVDVASGVESAAGVKDLQLVARFITACRTAAGAGSSS